MLTIKEICDRTGIAPHTFQSWRRDGLKLLPRPVAVEKQAICFDDSILERIRFIKEQRAAGKKLREINDVFESYYAFLRSAEVDEHKAGSLNNIAGRLTAHEAELRSRLESLEADFKRNLEYHEQRIKGLFRDFQAAMAENNLAAFLAAMSDNGLACRDRPLADSSENPDHRETNSPDGGI